MSELDFLLAVVATYPRASAVIVTLSAFVLFGANVRPSEQWALAHPFLFQCLRGCRALVANVVKFIALLQEWRKDGSLAAVQAFFERGRATGPTSAPKAAQGPTLPDLAPSTDRDPTTETTPVSPSEAAGRIGGGIGGSGRRA